jgi:hypothetical protein
MSRPRNRLALVAIAATVQLAASVSFAQDAPRACVSSAAASLVPTTRFTAVSAVMTASDTLWVLYSDHDARNIDAVSLLEVRHIGHAQNVEVQTHEVGEGSVTQGSLAVVGNNIVGAFVQTDHHVGVFSYPVNGGTMEHVALDAPQPPVSLSATTRSSRGTTTDAGFVTRGSIHTRHSSATSPRCAGDTVRRSRRGRSMERSRCRTPVASQSSRTVPLAPSVRVARLRSRGRRSRARRLRTTMRTCSSPRAVRRISPS